VTVALIEAGPPDDAPEIQTPLAFPQLFKTQYDWDYATEPEPWLDRRRVYLPRGRTSRGRTLGGSSSINAMVYTRGNRIDYDDWATEGASGWGNDAVLPYFIKAEANQRGSDQYHGAFGPLSVSDSRSPHELYDAFIEAGLQAGCSYNADFNGRQQDGVGPYQLTQRNGMRCSAAVAYLHPSMQRANLTVITSGLVTRILFDGSRASGVELVRRGNPLKGERSGRSFCQQEHMDRRSCCYSPVSVRRRISRRIKLRSDRICRLGWASRIIPPYSCPILPTSKRFSLLSRPRASQCCRNRDEGR
jgi:choline dehydrogenase-like flavoprotein